MVDTITLSIPAADVLSEQLNLQVRQYPFEFPWFTEGPEERARFVERVQAELESFGLTRDGRPEPEVEDALYLLCSSELSIAVAGLDVRSGQRLAARVVATGEVGVVGVVDHRGLLRMTFLPPDDLATACVDLLPDAPPGAGRAVSALIGRGADEQVREITGRPKFRLGHFVLSTNDRGRRRTDHPGLAWMDTDRGRYSLLGETTPEGQLSLTCTPVDKAKLAGQLALLVGRAQQG